MSGEPGVCGPGKVSGGNGWVGWALRPPLHSLSPHEAASPAEGEGPRSLGPVVSNPRRRRAGSGASRRCRRHRALRAPPVPEGGARPGQG